MMLLTASMQRNLVQYAQLVLSHSTDISSAGIPIRKVAYKPHAVRSVLAGEEQKADDGQFV